MPELRALLITDPDEWNAFVETARYRAFPQLWEWGELRRPFGWRPVRLALAEPGEAPIAGAQLLLRRVPAIGWHLAYAPRGPIGAVDDPAVRVSLISAIRSLAGRERIATLRIDPEAGRDDGLGAALLAPPWRKAPKVQPPSSRLLDLTRSEADLRDAMKRKHRQYVNKAERAGVGIESFDAASDSRAATAALDDFNRIYRLTAERGGFVARAPEYYRRVWELFAPRGHCRLWFATLDGQRVATLFHFVCGDRVAESYGGMTDAGAESRANYLLKWRAITGFQAEGLAVYDMWGLATGGIRQFKEGFGGVVAEYVGARDLVLRAPVDAALRIAVPAYGMVQRMRLRLHGRTLSPSDD